MFETHPRGGTSMRITRQVKMSIPFFGIYKIFQLSHFLENQFRAAIRLQSDTYTDAELEVVVVVVAEVTATC